mmetsp:Transcript_72572/g.121603  ORF Transcript_72572/g.121603 Transcript_72572/m.121603 type:complete len:215 (-) Transcript_72572:840-1484(-)
MSPCWVSMVLLFCTLVSLRLLMVLAWFLWISSSASSASSSCCTCCLRCRTAFSCSCSSVWCCWWSHSSSCNLFSSSLIRSVHSCTSASPLLLSPCSTLSRHSRAALALFRETTSFSREIICLDCWRMCSVSCNPCVCFRDTSSSCTLCFTRVSCSSCASRLDTRRSICFSCELVQASVGSASSPESITLALVRLQFSIWSRRAISSPSRSICAL